MCILLRGTRCTIMTTGRRHAVRVNAHRPDAPLPDHSLALRIMEAIAIQVCKRDTHDDQACAVAWDTFDELHRALLRRNEQRREEDPLELYCQEDPSALECRIYDV